jgi:YVTN family beta-propeller protein
MKNSRLSWCVSLAALVVSVVAATAEAQPYAYVLGRDSSAPRRNILTVIDGATNTKGPRIVLGTSNGFILPQALAMAPDGDRVYVVNDLEATISVVSTATNAVVDTWPTSLVGTAPRAVTVSPDGQRVYVVGNNQGVFIAIDVASRSRAATVNHNLSGTFGVAASPDGTRVYIMATFSDTLAVLSTAPYRVIATMPLNLEAGLLRADAITLSPDGRFLYIPQASGLVDSCGSDPNCIPLSPPAGALPSRVAVLDTTTNAFVAMTSVGGKPYHVAVSPNGAFVYAPNYGTGLHRLSPTTHASLGVTTVSRGRAVEFSADSTRAYVATDTGVVVISSATHAVVATIPFASGVDGVPNAVVTTPPPPPSPPSNLRGTVTGNRVSLTWDPSPSDAVSGYAVEGGVTPGSVLATLPTGSTAPSFTFDAPSGAFFVRLRALSGGRRSPASNEIYILVNVPQPPSAPANLLGLANGSNLALSWRTTTAGGTPASFVLDVSGALNLSVPLPASETFSYTGVPDGTYTFAVRAINGTGTSAASPPVTLTFPSACPGAPQAPTGFAVTRVGSQLTVGWDPPVAGPAVSSYVLQVTGALNLALPLTARSISGGVGPGTYNLSVVAVNPCGSGVATAPQSVTVP